jgi:hypothetical protein
VIVVCGVASSFGRRADYMEMAIQFGFLVMFGASFATAPMMCFIFTVVQLKQASESQF